MNIFIGHKKDATTAEIMPIVRNLERQALAAGRPARVMLGRADYEATFDYCREQATRASGGAWDLWETSVAHRYDLVVIPNTEGVGKATAGIIEKMLASDKQVAYSADGIHLVRVTGVENTTGDRFGPWKLLLETPE